MKNIILILIPVFLGLSFACLSQEKTPDGTVSYISSQNVYVKFTSTDNLKIGDTLFVMKGENLVPALVVNNLSSISAVCTSLLSEPFTVSDQIIVKQKQALAPAIREPDKKEGPVQKEEPKQQAQPVPFKQGKTKDTRLPENVKEEEMKPQQDITGRVAISSYSNFSNTSGGNSQRMRYTFSLNARNIANTKLSGETYISFVHKDDNWNDIQDNIFNGLKIYNLSLNYEISRNFKVWLGRKINPRITNIGAIDGIQFESKFKSLTLGLIAGSRPDIKDYSFNFSLFQYGAYLSHDLVNRKGNMQSSLAFAEQKNNGNTDRRFLYFQHSNSLVKGLYFFGTIEFDLNKYDTVQEKLTNAFDLTNIYLSLRYRFIKQLSLTVSYSSRQNIVYYETYKTILDQILDYETLQGYMARVTYNPIRYLSIGASAGYRYKKSDPFPSRNFYGYVTYSRIPFIKASATASVTLLRTSYIKGKIYSIGISRDLLKGRLYSTLGYRYVDYTYINAESSIPQNMAEVSLNWIIYKKLALSVNYEGTFEKVKHFNRLYINLTQRF